MPQFADVALPVAVDKTFTYLIPPELQHAAVVGVRVTVPFGRKFVTGLVVGLSDSSTVKGIKPVSDVIDTHPVLPAEMLELCRWIAGYYLAPLGEVVKAALPLGFAASKRVVRLSLTLENLDTAVRALKSRSPKRAKLLSLLNEHGPLTSAELRKRTGLKTINAVLNDMEREGLIGTEEIIARTRKKAREQEFVLVDAIDTEQLAAALQTLGARKKNARQLLTTLTTLKGRFEISTADLLKTSRASSRALKDLVASGVVKVQKREVLHSQDYGIEEQTLHIQLNADQQGILRELCKAIDAHESKPFLLHGVTGSGKTQVYIEAIRHCLSKGRSAIVLVPEISLTPQIVRRFRSHFGDDVAVVHSRMSTGERHDVWRLARTGTYRIVIGPRSAVFAPVTDLGLIVVDEEHEASYKQYDATPRYNARDVAIVRASKSKATVVLGSATPSAESYHNAATGKYTLLEMPRRIDAVPMPAIEIVNMTLERQRAYTALKESLPKEEWRSLKEFKQSSISLPLKQKIEDRLAKNEGIILLQNRRGFAPFVECPDCGHTEMCNNCSITLTYHLAKKHLRCHYCGIVRPVPDVCPQCKGMNIRLLGIGTQRVEEELATLFPTARVLRMDLDTTSRKGAHDRILRRFGNGEADILLGTQMVAKGLDFPRVTLVGVISADTQMLLPDFRSSERTFQLLMQVAGRAGRSTLRGEVVIQTHQSHHYTLQHVVDHDVKKFYEVEMNERRELDYPPFSRMALVEARGENETAVRKSAELFAQLLKGMNSGMLILGPTPAVIAKINKQYRWHIIIKSPKAKDPSGGALRSTLRSVLEMYEQRASRSVNLVVDIDPVGLM